MNEITRRGLAVSDDDWTNADGYIICWEQMAFAKSAHRQLRTYFWGEGQGPPRASWGGWASVSHAHVYRSYRAATAAVPGMLADPLHSSVTPSDVRIVKVRVRQPVIVLDDVPYDVLQKMAEI